ncbi:putative glycosidase [Escovopsis weberi]|uniref:endo-1,3(4)-beta-glucanase n=1 Tax=Escovopsis weberi TaxID=150374 RepID=A0A0M8MVH0_ESCWE|nr:putative glycosidase [Escovopsis weberi]
MLAPTTTHLLALAAVLAGTACAQYSYQPPRSSNRTASSYYNLTTHYDANNFFDTFDFFDQPDPTHGFVQFVNKTTAYRDQLAGFAGHAIYMGADSKTTNPPAGRKAVRLSSQKSFTHGLFIADMSHMPDSTCGVWPAFWMFGPDWPSSGEIDIIEGISTQRKNQITLHTSDGCTITNAGTVNTTKLVSPVCDASKDSNAGCAQTTADETNYGRGFNQIGGGVYATEWTSDHIAVWFFPRNKIPRDVTSDNPDPSGWGPALAQFNSGPGCTLDQHFKENNIVFDITFCGDWAGAVWSTDAQCKGLAPTCQDYVTGNPTAFETAYWLVNYIKVFDKVDKPNGGRGGRGVHGHGYGGLKRKAFRARRH